MRKLDIIIVNWNAGAQLRECVDLVIQHGHLLVSKIIVVDNGSTDGSENAVEGLPNVILIRAGENLGFGSACNIGAAYANSEFLLFLNPDTRLFENSLSAPLAFMGQPENAQIGICGLQLVDESGKKCLSYARFPSLGRYIVQALGMNKFFKKDGAQGAREVLKGSNFLEVDQMIGAFFVVRMTVFEQLRGFDELFFIYFEEVDFSLRAYKKGWLSACITDAQCIHIGGGTSRQVKAARLFYSLRSRILYGFKHFSILQAVILLVVTVVPEFVSRSLFSLLRGAWQDLRHTVRGYSMLIKDMPTILMAAQKILQEHDWDCQ